jgi:hypothetical protein
MKKSMPLKTLLLASTFVSFSAFASEVITQTPQSPTPVTCSGADCQQAIAGNTKATADTLFELQANLIKILWGTNGDPFDNTATGSTIPASNQTLRNAAYLTVGLLLYNLPMPIDGSPLDIVSQYVNLVNGNNTTFQKGLNQQQQNTLTLQKSTLQNTQQNVNNGTNPIEDLDIQPFVIPKSIQSIRNSLTSIPTTEFLRGFAASPDQVKLFNNNNVCPISPPAGSGINAGSANTQRTVCITPVTQLNAVAGTGFLQSQQTTSSEPVLSYMTVPEYWRFFAGTTSINVAPSLTLDSLLNPLSYSEAQNGIQPQTLGLFGTNQKGFADNFIRYLTGELLPNKFSDADKYNAYKKVAESTTACFKNRVDARLKIQAYRTLLRTYAAQLSVGASNLYHSMDKRSTNTASGSSQLEEEFKMATHRIFQPQSNGNLTLNQKTQWQTDLENASGLAVQRQMAQLLAEINYQLFLNRQQQERVLITLSAIQLGGIAQQKKDLTIDSAAGFISDNQLSESAQCDTDG